ncbi:MAG: serine hydrolase [Cytophagales bacterium]|nr:serine hydrolase [Cytophagales bacterium]
MTYQTSRCTFCYIVFIFISFVSCSQKSAIAENPTDTLDNMTLDNKINGIVARAINERAFPGCVVFASHKGKPIFHKAYGYLTYDSLLQVDMSTIYDLASITKVTAATLSLMKLYEEGKLGLDNNLGDYVHGLSAPISMLGIRELLAHQSGLEPHILFYDKIRVDGVYMNKTLSHVRTIDYNWRIGRSLYAYSDIYPVLKSFINKAEVSMTKKYRYSGLFFYIVPELVKNLSNKSFESYLYKNFYEPLGAETLRFNAGGKFEDREIAPTELDALFRMELVHGNVHDEGAQLMRGVSGNAGLFSNAEDLAKVWQMLLNDGEYRNFRYLKPQTINLFTSVQFPNNDNRRGLGFDKIHFDYNPVLSHMAKSASVRSYGHTGFTGTMVWADPDEDLLFIFLSNRVHPSRSPNKLSELRVRPDIHQVFYDYLEGLENE